MRWDRRPGKILFWLISGSFLFHLLLSLKAGLVADEAYYWTWSLHPALSYFDHPPLIAWTLWVTTHLLGHNRLAVRIVPLLISLMISLVLYRMGKDLLVDRFAGLWAVLLANATLLFSAGAFLMTPDTLSLLFFLLTLWWFFLAIERDSARFMLGAGLWFGLGLLSKYTTVLLGPLLLLFLLLDGKGRTWIRRPALWGAALLSIALFSPVIVWNGNHHWASFLFQWHHGMRAHQMSPLSGLLDYLGAQFGAMTPIVYVLIVVAGILAPVAYFRDNLKENLRPVLYLWLTSYPILLFFAYSSMKAKVEANWPVEGYLGAFLVTGALISSWRFRPGLYRLALGGSVLGMVAALIVGIQIFWPIIPIDPNVDPTGRMAGFGTEDREIRAIVESFPAEKRPVGWVVDGYPNASLLKFLEYGRTPVYEIHPKRPFRSTVLSVGEANRLSGKPVLLIQNGPNGGFVHELNGIYGKALFLKTILVPRKGASDQTPIIETDVYLIPSFRNGLAEDRPPFLGVF